MSNKLKLVMAAAMAVCLQSCFTGIESTPRITANDVRNSGATVTAEQRFMEQVAGEQPTLWQPGKQWLVADDKISLIFTQPTSDADSLAGSRIFYQGQRQVVTVTGTEAVELSFRGERGQTLSYLTGLSPADFAKRAELEIPFAVELRPVEVADSLMRGHTYFITTPLWYDAAGRAEQGGLRHVAAKIDSVTAGNAIHPLRVAFHVEGDSRQHFVMMTYGNGHAATRNFDKLFAFTDPRVMYPQIEDENWQRIIHSQVSLGMTRDECRLALGTPTAIDRGATPAAQLERWSYDDGIYLIFEDGILARFRK